MLSRAAIILIFTINYLMLQLQRFTSGMHNYLIYIAVDPGLLVLYFRYISHLSLVITLQNQI